MDDLGGTIIFGNIHLCVCVFVRITSLESYSIEKTWIPYIQ